MASALQFLTRPMTDGGALHSVLDPAGPQAVHIARLWWVMIGVSVVVFVAVISMLTAAVARGRRRAASGSGDPETPAASLTRAVGAAVAITVGVLFVLLVVSVWTGRVVASLRASSAVSVVVTGHQWWWEVEYEDALPGARVTTANEIHVPIGHPIVLKVQSRDVIHSFWAPNLLGKRDLIPGYTTAVWFQVDRPGVFRGRCAEFCGRQHAHMAFDVVAEPEAAFETWLNAQRRLAPDPQTDQARRGREVFMAARCAGCHRVRGTDAGGQLGPDLTHLATRTTLGAGTLPNTPEHLAAWVENPQAPKPGNQMPPNLLTKDDLQALVAYLETLQ
jgi:cytochrome c oxidase subunit II